MKKNQPERAQRIAFIQLLQYKLPLLYESLFALEHGGSRHPLEAFNLKRMGVKAGLPDYFFMYSNNKYHGLFLEFKVNKNKLTTAQQEFFRIACDRNYKSLIVNTAEEAYIEICRYMMGKDDEKCHTCKELERKDLKIPNKKTLEAFKETEFKSDFEEYLAKLRVKK